MLLNYAHPLTQAQLEQVCDLEGRALEIRDIAVQVDRTRPLDEIATELANAADLTAEEWYSLSLIINPPGLAPLALALIAEIHGRSGHFPSILNVRPIVDSTLPRYEVAEVLNLQIIREAARKRP